jgi:hypothetical protein
MSMHPKEFKYNNCWASQGPPTQTPSSLCHSSCIVLSCYYCYEVLVKEESQTHRNHGWDAAVGKKCADSGVVKGIKIVQLDAPTGSSIREMGQNGIS